MPDKKIYPINMDNSRHRFIVSLLAVLTTLSAAEATPIAGARPAPKLVVNILVDRLRSDYLNAFLPLYGENGFKRLLNQGLVYSQAESTALPRIWPRRRLTSPPARALPITAS